MDTSLIFFIFVAIAAATILFMTAKVVPQREEWIVPVSYTHLTLPTT